MAVNGERESRRAVAQTLLDNLGVLPLPKQMGRVGLMAVAGARLRGAGHTRGDAVARILEPTGGAGVDSAIEALGADISFQTSIKITKPGGTIANIGYHGRGEFVHIPRIEWGVGMAEKTIKTGLCPGGRLRMERLIRILQGGRLDPTKMTTHKFNFAEMPRAFEIMDKKLDGVIKPLIIF